MWFQSGNIAKPISSSDMQPGVLPSPRFESAGEDAGNGSLMRLAAVPLFFHSDIDLARRMAFESSLTTHPGPMAAEACALMAHVIVRAITREPAQSTSSAFLDMYVCVCMYLNITSGECIGCCSHFW